MSISDFTHCLYMWGNFAVSQCHNGNNTIYYGKKIVCQTLKTSFNEWNLSDRVYGCEAKKAMHDGKIQKTKLDNQSIIMPKLSLAIKNEKKVHD